MKGAPGVVLGLGLGYLIGVAAWGPGRVPVLAILLPAGIAVCRSRAAALAFAAAYAGGLLRFAVSFIGSWFNDSVLVGAAAVAAYMLMSGAVWCAGWTRSQRKAVRAGRMSLAWLLALGPAAVAVPGHPLAAVGFLLPGAGWLGVAASLVVAAGLAAWTPELRARLSRPATLTIAFASCVGLAVVGRMLVPYSAGASTQQGIHAVTTSWGRLASADQGIDRITAMASASVPEHVSVVVWPESIVGRWDPSMYQVLDVEVLRAARAQGRTEVVGMDIPVSQGKFLNSAVAFYPDGTSQTATARQPAPLSLWRPWATETFLADWSASNILQLGEERAALIFCYEEYMPILYLINEARDRPTFYLALANTWAARQRQASIVQTWHSLGMARLFGRPYLRAENQPADTPGGMPMPSYLRMQQTTMPASVAPAR